MKKNRSVLITDLDDTLWDWVKIWYASFDTLTKGIAEVLDLPLAELYRVIRPIHQNYGTSEFSFLAHEIELHFDRFPNDEFIRKKYKDVLHAAQKARKNSTAILPGVSETLRSIKNNGTKIIGYTESQYFATIQRIKAFDLDGIFDCIYSPEDHEIPHYIDPNNMRSKSKEFYELVHTEHYTTPPGVEKPSSSLLKKIISDQMTNVDECVYVGDKLYKDVLMAQEANVLDVHAAYGSNHNSKEYVLLKKVTHWSDEAVTTENNISDEDIRATIKLEKSYTELFEYINFTKFES